MKTTLENVKPIAGTLEDDSIFGPVIYAYTRAQAARRYPNAPPPRAALPGPAAAPSATPPASISILTPSPRR